MTFKIEEVDFGDVALKVRQGTFDREMAREIFEDEYYTVGGWDVPPNATVLDIGGGIGAFAAFACARGASKVYTFEPDPDSFALLVLNTSAFPWMVSAIESAVAVEAGSAHLSGYSEMPDGTINTGRAALSDEGIKVTTVSIHSVLTLEEHWDVVKIDIEGGEYPILYALTDDEFSRMSVITMEFHHTSEDGAHERGLLLAEHLHSRGFSEVEVDYAWGEQGRLRARR